MADFSVHSVRPEFKVRLEIYDDDNNGRGWMSIVVDSSSSSAKHDITLFGDKALDVARSLRNELNLAVTKVELAQLEKKKKE